MVVSVFKIFYCNFHRDVKIQYNLMFLFVAWMINIFWIFCLSGAVDYPCFFGLLKQLVGPLSTQLSDRRSSIVKQVHWHFLWFYYLFYLNFLLANIVLCWVASYSLLFCFPCFRQLVNIHCWSPPAFCILKWNITFIFMKDV